MNILLIIISLTIIYGLLIYIILKNVNFKKMIYLSISILVFFIFLQIKIFDSLGYPVISDLPKSFDILYVEKSESQFIVLIKDFSEEDIPRLYKLEYSKDLEDILNDAMTDISNGKRVIGVIDDSNDDNHCGISIKHIKKLVPDK